ncbi:hypothetical protein P4O66_003811 [Electrophorus voltai]|uniref:Reverse transcriptase domain-containing protein n=1 Tax=Electrophorus voltai TaxID=2609070 RepID=A0AAD8ZR20_9TELE|nr:hypothetical protein P4O66_003811 [Electrophorus voltai]
MSCHRRCFPNKATPLQATSIESSDADRWVPIPSEYQDLEQVFSPSKATRLLQHRDWDCSITLKEGVVPPQCRIHPLSQEEEWAMEQYIKEVLQQGYVQPSTSPASAGFFFVKKRDGGLRPCVDYRGLNKLLVQYLCIMLRGAYRTDLREAGTLPFSLAYKGFPSGRLLARFVLGGHRAMLCGVYKRIQHCKPGKGASLCILFCALVDLDYHVQEGCL